MNLTLESLNRCPLCDGTRSRALLRVADHETATGEYGLIECGDCGVAFTSPRPVESDLPSLYQGRTTTDFAAGKGGVVDYLRALAVDAYVKRTFAAMAVDWREPVTVLDYGCGDGALALGIQRLARSNRARAQVIALDFHRSPPPALAGAAGSDIVYASHDEWQARGRRFDLVFLRHVLEHHPDPRRLLAGVRDLLLPGGRLCVEVPNRRSVWARICGRYYFAYYVPRHLLHFDPSSLRSAVESSGMRCVAIRGGHTPVLGRSIAYRTGWNIGNLGVLGLATYPLQIALDALAGTSSTVQMIAAV